MFTCLLLRLFGFNILSRLLLLLVDLYALLQWVSEQEVREVAERYGAVQSCVLAECRTNGKSRGFAKVTYEQPGCARVAKQELNGRIDVFPDAEKPLVVEFPKPASAVQQPQPPMGAAGMPPMNPAAAAAAAAAMAAMGMPPMNPGGMPPMGVPQQMYPMPPPGMSMPMPQPGMGDAAGASLLPLPANPQMLRTNYRK